MEQKVLQIIKKDFKEFVKSPEVLAVLVFGSQVSGEATARSDVDICIIAPATKDRVELLREVWREVGGKYDLWLFEELPLYIQAAIIEKHEIIFCRDLPELFEYFYPFRKRIADFYHRQHVAMNE